MHGTFNGVRLRTISSRKIAVMPCGARVVGFRVTGKIPKATMDSLDATLRLHGPALLILSDEILEGHIVHFSADVTFGYEITMEIPASS
jgi:hypothetical protein